MREMRKTKKKISYFSLNSLLCTKRSDNVFLSGPFSYLRLGVQYIASISLQCFISPIIFFLQNASHFPAPMRTLSSRKKWTALDNFPGNNIVTAFYGEKSLQSASINWLCGMDGHSSSSPLKKRHPTTWHFPIFWVARQGFLTTTQCTYSTSIWAALNYWLG